MTLTNEELFNINNNLEKYKNINLDFCNKSKSIGIMNRIENDRIVYYVYQTTDMEYAHFRADSIPIEWTKSFNNFLDALEFAKIMYNNLRNSKDRYTRKLTK